MNNAKIGTWSFIAGMGLALLAAFVLSGNWVGWVLVSLGIVIGFLNISKKESQGFLVATLALWASFGALNELGEFGAIMTRISFNVVRLISPAMLIVSLRYLFTTAKD